MNPGDIRKIYSGLKQKNETLLSELKKKHLLISLLRLFIFIAGVILSAILISRSLTGGIIVLVISMIFFILLVKIYEDYSGRITFVQNLVRINDNEINALDGDLSAFDGGSDHNDPKHDFSGDIDLFGEDSLFMFLNRTVSGSGRSQLAAWLSRPFDLRDEITDRQEAVRELAEKLGWRQQFMAFGFNKPLNDKEIHSLSEWLNENDDSYSSGIMRIASFVLPVGTIVTLSLVIAGIIPYIIFMLLFLFNLFLIGLYLKKSNRIHAMVSRKQLFLSSFEQLISSFEKEEFRSGLMSDIRNKLCAGQGSVANKIQELNKIISAFDNRLNMFVGLILNGFLLWDFHCIMKLEKWRRSAASGMPVWLNLLGKADGLISLANYSFNNHDNIFPEVVQNGPVLEAFRMSHPLLKRETRISNDFSVGQRGRVFIITGANMAGKSTFLRTVAVNMILGMTGAPVCAEKMTFTPVRLFTSMRTVDSLSHNESYFYAELKRLKALKERLEKGEEILFILDEILKGTNSTDKSLGSKQFLRRIIDLGGTGLIATHDISLGEMEAEYPRNVVNKCFEIEIDGENIKFDYLLRDGITRKMNAAALMRQMGIA
jgi:hypothetical protein